MRPLQYCKGRAVRSGRGGLTDHESYSTRFRESVADLGICRLHQFVAPCDTRGGQVRPFATQSRNSVPMASARRASEKKGCVFSSFLQFFGFPGTLSGSGQSPSRRQNCTGPNIPTPYPHDTHTIPPPPEREPHQKVVMPN